MTTNFFRKILPDICVTFSSKKGKLLFKEALEEGHMDSFFHFGAQLRTQDEPAYCGLSSLVIVLNGLSVDPGRVWKGVWRWYHESMLECCTPLEEVKSKGVSLDELTCIARCNQLIADQVYVNDTTSIDEFRNKVKDVTKSSTAAIICSFSREVLSQSGTGHFSPIGGYHPETDSVLMLEPARFKYPLFWIPISLLWDAMNTKDTDTGVSRGYMVLKRSNTQPTLLFRISRYFNAIHPLHADAVDFLTNAVTFLKKSCRDTNDPSTIINEVAEKLLKISAEQKANHEKGLLFHTFVKS
uniref:glutathione gamma-glutamylcysteinyltransferase n=1 Tax=Ciona savignyi TaxID=51511 RepID=H2ZEH9_CIOSA